jgi:hypothetical protein
MYKHNKPYSIVQNNCLAIWLASWRGAGGWQLQEDAAATNGGALARGEGGGSGVSSAQKGGRKMWRPGRWPRAVLVPSGDGA